MSKYLLSNLEDGKPPGFLQIGDDYVAAPGEVVVDDVPPGWVWDAASERLREPNVSDEIKRLKEEQKIELATQALTRVGQRLSLPTQLALPQVGIQEVLMRHSVLLAALCEAVGIPIDPAVDTIHQTGNGLLGAIQEVEAVPADAPDAKAQIMGVELPPDAPA